MPLFGVIQIATLLDMARVCGNGCIGHSQKALGNDSSYFEAVEVLMSYLRQNSLQGGLDLFGSEGPKEHHLHLCSHEKESPANGMDLLIQGETIQGLDHAPIPRTGFVFQPEKFGDQGSFLNQNRSDGEGWHHGVISQKYERAGRAWGQPVT